MTKLSLEEKFHSKSSALFGTATSSQLDGNIKTDVFFIRIDSAHLFFTDVITTSVIYYGAFCKNEKKHSIIEIYLHRKL